MPVICCAPIAVQHLVLLGVGAVISILSLIGLALLIVADIRSRRSRLDVEAVDTDGVPRPGEPLDIPEGTRAAVSPSADPWKLPVWQASFFLLFVLMVGIVLFLRLFKLDTLGSEIYGDIIIVRNYLQGVLAGKWPVRFDLSAGPLYHYLIAPIIAVVGLDYAGLKLASVLVSLGVLAATYAFSRRLVNDYFALLTTFIAGVSSWLLIFSRLGNSQILLPLLTAAALWLVIRVVQRNRQSDLIACAIVSALGLYVYPQSFVLPGAIFLTLLFLRWTGFPITGKRLGLFALIVLVCAIPFVFIVGIDPANFSEGYIGSKMKTEGDFLPLLGQSVVRALLAFNVRGDESFRSNPSGLAQLDRISGILFLVGIGFLVNHQGAAALGSGLACALSGAASPFDAGAQPAARGAFRLAHAGSRTDCLHVGGVRFVVVDPANAPARLAVVLRHCRNGGCAGRYALLERPAVLQDVYRRSALSGYANRPADCRLCRCATARHTSLHGRLLLGALHPGSFCGQRGRKTAELALR